MDYPEDFKYKVDRNTPLTLRIFWETSRRSIGNRALSKSTRINLHKVGWEEVLQTMPVPFLAEKKHNHKSVLKIGKLVKT